MNKTEINGQYFVQVGTTSGNPILLKENYVKIYEVAGLDLDSPLQVEDDFKIIADGSLVGYFGYKE